MWVVACPVGQNCGSNKYYIAALINVNLLFQGIIDLVQKHKLLFIETQDAAETTLALINYHKVIKVKYANSKGLFINSNVYHIIYKVFLNDLSYFECKKNNWYR